MIKKIIGKQVIQSVKIWIVVFLSACLFWVPVSAQKIQVVKKGQFQDNIAITLDTLQVHFVLTKLSFKDIQYYSIVYQRRVPTDFHILLREQFSGYPANNSDVYILYHVKTNQTYPGFTARDWQIYNLQNWLINPFIDRFGRMICHVFRFEIWNHRKDKIQVESQSFIAVSDGESHVPAMNEDDFIIADKTQENISSSDQDDQLFMLKQKIIEDNLFADNVIYRDSGAEGLICFSRREARNLTRIIIPAVQFFKDNKVISKHDIEIRNK